jgi:hypothetical protein
LQHPNLQQIIGFFIINLGYSKESNEQLCGSTYKLFSLIDYCDSNLEQVSLILILKIIQKHKLVKNRIQEEYLWKLLNSVINGMAYLQS